MARSGFCPFECGSRNISTQAHADTSLRCCARCSFANAAGSSQVDLQKLGADSVSLSYLSNIDIELVSSLGCNLPAALNPILGILTSWHESRTHVSAWEHGLSLTMLNLREHISVCALGRVA